MNRFSLGRGRMRLLFFIAVVIFIVTACPVYKEPALAGPALHSARVIEVNDGDTVTLRMDGRVYRTRLIGIDAPEMGQAPWGERAKEHLRKFIKDTQWEVYVETDLEKYDKYDRLLVYLWSKQKTLINEQMLRDGYAVLFTIQPNTKYAARFKDAAASAHRNKSGIWGTNGLKERPLDYKKAHPRMSY